MAKVKLERKKELREPDEFIVFSQKLLNYALAHRLKIAAVGSAVLLIVLTISIAIYWSGQRQNKAFTALNAIEAEDTQSAFQDRKKAYQTFLQEYSGTVAASVGAVRFAGLCYDQREYDEAIKWYQNTLEEFESNDAMRNILLSGIGYASAGKKDYDAAVSAFEKIVSSGNAVMKDQAFFQLGLIYEAIGKQDKSSEAFNSIVSNYPDSVFYRIAREKK